MIPVLGLLCISSLFTGLALGAARVSGRVVNETNAPVGGARIIASKGDFRAYAVTDPGGAFDLRLNEPGEYLFAAERAGHFELRNQRIVIVEGANEVNLVLNRLREVFEHIDVKASGPDLALDTSAKEETLTGNQIINIPYPTTNNLKSALRAMPGVLPDSRGEIHINGAAAEQVQYTLDGFNLSDPSTGRFESRISVEGVQSVDVISGRVPAEYGKGSAGVVSIVSKPGDDKFRISGTNFVPGIEFQKRIGVGGWTPRFNLSGPIRRSRAWFSNSFDLQYNRNLVRELPAGQDSVRSWRTSNLTHTQVNLTPSAILYSSFLLNLWYAPRNGLTALDPLETTVDRRARQYFANARLQKYFGRGAVLETGFAVNRVFGREIPQGSEIYEITPQGRRGNFFVDARRKSRREQWITNAFLPAFTWFGGHQLKAGIDFNRLAYWQDVHRTAYAHFRYNGTPQRLTRFYGDGLLRRSNSEMAGYVQDSWKVRPGLLLELGLRTDWDQIIRRWNTSPRIGFAWSPPRLDNTKVSGGAGITYDATPIRLFTRPDDQYPETTYFSPEGAIDRGPALTIFRVLPGNLRAPRYRNYSLSVEHRLPSAVSVRFNLIRRRGVRGLSYTNTVEPGGHREDSLLYEAIYYLGNQRRDEYDAVEVAGRQALPGGYEWMVSFTRSRASSNAVVDINNEEPLLIGDNSGRMPWDSPNRLLGWGYLPTFWKNWAFAFLADYRTGAPFSVVDDRGFVLGAINSRRLPAYFELNLHLERRFAFRGHRWAFRFGSNNITNRQNPNQVINNIASPIFLTYYGGQGRSTNFRIRWLGRQ
ncbi:MAG: TonB-dependent receptor [Bryobacteraceae bacterium]|nr:TonB-dependent receptor [Bryobacteraceae bacterium]